MLARRISPFEGGRGDVSSDLPHPSHLSHLSHNRLCGSHSHLSHLSHLSHNCPCLLARRISPFEGSPRASAAEYVLGGMFPPISPPKNFLSLTPDFQPLNYFPQKNLKKSCQKICRIKKTPYLCTRKWDDKRSCKKKQHVHWHNVVQHKKI